VDRVVAAEKVYQQAVEVARDYARGPRLALRAAKTAVNWGGRVDLRTGVAIEREVFSGLFATEDQREGMRSFVEKGPGKATFKGR
jgi:enoyl-CoA hydratase/carnithine racemase